MAIYTTSGGYLGGWDVEIFDNCPIDQMTNEPRVDIEYIDENDGIEYMLQYNLRVHDPRTGAKALIYAGRVRKEKK